MEGSTTNRVSPTHRARLQDELTVEGSDATITHQPLHPSLLRITRPWRSPTHTHTPGEHISKRTPSQLRVNTYEVIHFLFAQSSALNIYL